MNASEDRGGYILPLVVATAVPRESVSRLIFPSC